MIYSEFTRGLTDEDLKELLKSSSEEKFDEFVRESEDVKSLDAEREILMASVRSLADFNLAKKADYEATRDQLTSLVGDCNLIKEEIQRKADTLLQISQATSLDTTMSVLRAAASSAEEDSEEYAKQFLNGDLDYDTFTQGYCERRKMAHLRRIKADKLRNQISINQ